MASSLGKVSNEQVLKDWLAEYKSLPDSSLPEYAKNINEKSPVLSAFKAVICSPANDVTSNLIQSCCHQLFNFNKSGITELRLFASCFLPAVIHGYLLACFSRDQNSSEFKVATATYLLAVYNILCASSNTETLNSMEIPNLSRASVYHDPMMYPFSEHTITVPNPDTTFIETPTPVTYDAILPSNRCQILNFVLMSYCDHISAVSKQSLQQFCNLCLFLGSQGFPWQLDYYVDKMPQKPRRIQIDTNITLTIVRGVYFALYNGCRIKGIKAVEAMQKRAEYELNAQVLLLCNAILDTISQEGTTLQDDNPLGLAVSLTPSMTRSSSAISRLAVTASSIRHHRWRHRSEEVSGDVTESLQQEDPQVNPKAKLEQNVEEESSKFDKHSSVSPSKLLKNKLKKSMPSPSTGDAPAHKGAVASEKSEKKGKKWLPTFSSTEDEPEPIHPRISSENLLGVKDPLSSVSLSSLKIQEEGEQRGEEQGAKMTSSKSVDMESVRFKVVDARNNQSGGTAAGEAIERPASPANRSKPKGKHRSKGESEIKELLSSGMKRSGSKKYKEQKSGSAAPLLATDGDNVSITTEL